MNLKRNPKVSKKIFCYLRGGCKEGNYIHRNLKGGSKNGRTFGNGKKLPPVTTIVSMGISVISVPGFGFSFWGSFRGSFRFSLSRSLSKIVVRISVVSIMVGISIISTMSVVSSVVSRITVVTSVPG